MSSALGRGASQLWGWLASARGSLYEKGVLKRIQVPVPVVSVGNLTVGGTGKTPIVKALAELFHQEKRHVGIIARNYRAKARDPQKVLINTQDGAVYFGDEPYLLAQQMPWASVFVGPRKNVTARRALIEEPKLDLLLIDDGFQHRALARDLDVVLVDATDEKSFEPLPAGRAREGAEALGRADWILLTKTNWATSEQLEKARKNLPSDKPCTEVKFQTRWPEVDADVEWGVFAGIARPQVFFNLARKKYFGKILKTWPFRDHQVYGEKELASLREFLKANPKAWLLTTEKDAVKIEDDVIRDRMRVAKIEIEWQNAGDFFERLRTLVR